MANYSKVIPPAKEGDPITAAMWNQLVDAINKNRVNFGQGNGFSVQQTPLGQMVRLAGESIPVLAIAKTTSTISARAGTAAGSGTATVQAFDGTNLAADGLPDVTVYNFSAASIATGKYCAICDCGDDYPFVISVEC